MEEIEDVEEMEEVGRRLHIGQGPDREQKIENEDDENFTSGDYFRFNVTEDSCCQIEQK